MDELIKECEKAYSKKDYSRLDWACNKILENHKNNETALSYKLYIYCDWHQYHLVFRIADKINRLYPNNYHAYNAKAIAYSCKKEFKKSLDSCNKGLEIKDYWWLRINKIEALISLNRIDEAYEFYNSFEIQNYNFTKALINCGKYSEISKYEERLSNEELLSYYFKRCSFLDKWGNHEEILKVCEEILKIDNDNEFALEYKTNSLSSLEDKDEVLKCLNHSIKLYPDNFRFYLKKGETLLWGFEDIDGAIECYEKGFALVEDFERCWFDANNLVDTLNKKADQLIESGKWEDAVYIYDKILFYKPNEFEAFDKINSLTKEHNIDYTHSKHYNESLKLKEELQRKIKQLDNFLETIVIGEYDEDYVNGCSEFKDYNSFEEYVRDVIICLMESYPKRSEEYSRLLVKSDIHYIKSSFEHEEPADECIIVVGYGCG